MNRLMVKVQDNVATYARLWFELLCFLCPKLGEMIQLDLRTRRGGEGETQSRAK